MPKIFMKTAYEFYDKPEPERKDLVGSYFKEENRDSLFFPLQLLDGEFNYGIQQGLIFISSIMTSKDGKWFRVGAFSPDDLDMDLDFNAQEIHLRQDVIEYVKKMPKQHVTYLGVMKDIQSKFNAGKIY